MLAGRAEAASEARAGLYVKFQDMLVKELPAIFLYTPTYEYLIDKKVKNVNIGRIFSPADRFSGLADWYIKTKWGWK